MALESALNHLKKYHYEDKVLLSEESSATVALAAIAFNCKEQEIAKSLSFHLEDGSVILVICAGDTKVDNAKYKAEFKCKARMLAYDSVEELIGHAAGGVCPFGIKENVKVYLDESLKRFSFVYPACGTSNSAVKLTINELETCSNYEKWVDVCKIA